MSDTITQTELACRFGVHEKTVMRWIRTGELRASRLGRGRYIIRTCDLEAFLDARATRPARVGPGKPIEPASVATAPVLRPAAPGRRRTGTQRGVLTAPARARP